MNVEITDKHENPLLSRLEIKGKVEFEAATPSKQKLKGALAKQLESGENLIIVKNLQTRYGSTVADFLAYQYFSEEELKSMERPSKKEEAAEAKDKPEPKKEESAKEKPEAKEEKKE